MFVGLREKLLILIMVSIILLGVGTLMMIRSQQQQNQLELSQQITRHHISLYQEKLAAATDKPEQLPLKLREFTLPQSPGMSARLMDDNGLLENSGSATGAAGNSIWNLLALENERLQFKTAMVKLKAHQANSLHLLLTIEGKQQVAALAYLPQLHRFILATMPPAAPGKSDTQLNFMVILLLALILTGSLILITGQRLLVLQLRHLIDGARKLADGDYKIRLVVDQADELGQVTQAFNRMASKIEKSQAQLQENLETLRASEQRFATIFNAVPDPIFITRLDNGAVVDVNEAFQRRAELSRDEAIGMSQEQLGLWPEAGERTLFESILARHHQVRGFECPTCVNGVERRDAISAAIIELDGQPHMLAISRDVTEIRRQEAALRASEVRNTIMLRMIPDYFGVSRYSDGIMVVVNDGFEKLIGWSREETIGRRALDLDIWAWPADRLRFAKRLKAEGSISNMEIEFKHKNGSLMRGLVSASTFEFDGVRHIGMVVRDITETKKQENALRQSYETLARVQKIADMGIWQWQAEKDLIYWSKTVYDIFQLTPPLESDAPPGYAGAIPANRLLDLLHPDDRELYRQQIRIIMTQGGHQKTRVRILRPDGSIRYVLSQGDIGDMRDGSILNAYGFVQDITEQVVANQKLQEQEAALRASEQKFSAIFNAIPDMIGVTRVSDGTVIDFNQKFEQASKIEQDQGIGRHISEFDIWVNDSDRQRFFSELEQTGMVRELECDIYTHNQQQIHALISGQLFELNGQPHVVTIAHDVTELRQKEAALHRSLLAQQTAEAAQQTAEAATNMKSDFLAMISHEVRTPLGGVIGMLRFGLKDPLLSYDTRAKLSVGLANAEVLLQIINDILDYSKLEAGKMTIEMIDFDLPGLVRDAVAIMEERAEAKGLTLVAEMQRDLPVWWHGDPTRLRQVLINLIGNAIKFTETGSVKVRVKTEANEVVSFMVRDTGIGISTEAVSRLFQKYQQADASTARKFGGTGLGLAICKRIVEAMQGSIHVASKLEVGSTFTVFLPLTAGSVNLAQASIAHLEPHSHQLRILCAEDGATNQIIIRELVSTMGHQIDLAEDGIAALTSLSLHDYDLVLMDSRMPRLEGIEALRLLRQKACDVRDPAIPVVALTANVSESERERFFHAGADGFIGKPIDEAELHLEIKRMIDLLLEAGHRLPPNPLAQPAASHNAATPASLAPGASATTVGSAATVINSTASTPVTLATPVPDQPPANKPPQASPAAPASKDALKAFSPKMQQNLIGMFSNEAPRLLAEVGMGLANGEGSAVAIAAHSLKGCSSYFDVPELHRLCKEIELAGNQNDLERVRNHFPAFGSAVEHAINYAAGLRIH